MTEDKRKKLTRWLWMLVLCPMALVFGLLFLVWAFADIPSFKELEDPDTKLATQVIADGGEILTTYHIENRSYASYDDLSPYLVHAAVATEDKRFYEHSGIDMKSLGRVAVKTLLMSNSSQGGGSTITQQLAKTLYPREKMSGYSKPRKAVAMVWVKLKEWITAVKLERNYTKDEILVMYLNSVEYSSLSFGVKAAAQTFFAKSPSDLNVEEAAMLVGMVNAPTRYNPVRNPDNALSRRNLVLKRMYEDKRLFDADGNRMTRDQLDSLMDTPIDCSSYVLQDHNAGLAPYFRDYLRRYMNASKPKRSSYQFPEEFSVDSLRWADDELYGWLQKNKKPDGSEYNLDKDGLRIYTTINYKMQKYAEEAMAEHMANLQKSFWTDLKYKKNRPFSNDVDQETVDRVMKQARRWSERYRVRKAAGMSEAEIMKTFDEPVQMRVFTWDKKGYIDTTMTPNDSIRYYKSFLRSSFVAMEPETGHVKAYVGGPNYRYFKYDNVTQGKRQVGSTIKPFLYTLAMQEGMSPCDETVCVPQTFIVGNDTWTPRSTDKDQWIGQTVTLKWGLTNSSNNISAYLMKLFGPTAMVDMMHKMGVGSHVEEVPSICVGSADLYLYEMVAAYNTFPSKGVYVTPIFVTRIEDKQGNVLGEFNNRKREAISESTAYLMENLMQGVVNNGTAGRLRSVYRLQGQIAGKTGTTNDNSDGWFIGYTPSITAGIWTGGEDRQVHFESLALGGGSNMALPIWGIWMKKIIADGTLGISEKDAFIAPAGVSVNLNCTGGDSDARVAEQAAEEYYFD